VLDTATLPRPRPRLAATGLALTAVQLEAPGRLAAVAPGLAWGGAALAAVGSALARTVPGARTGALIAGGAPGGLAALAATAASVAACVAPTWPMPRGIPLLALLPSLLGVLWLVAWTTRRAVGVVACARTAGSEAEPKEFVAERLRAHLSRTHDAAVLLVALAVSIAAVLLVSGVEAHFSHSGARGLLAWAASAPATWRRTWLGAALACGSAALLWRVAVQPTTLALVAAVRSRAVWPHETAQSPAGVLTRAVAALPATDAAAAAALAGSRERPLLQTVRELGGGFGASLAGSSFAGVPLSVACPPPVDVASAVFSRTPTPAARSLSSGRHGAASLPSLPAIDEDVAVAHAADVGLGDLVLLEGGTTAVVGE
jgi:hypothetical protein